MESDRPKAARVELLLDIHRTNILHADEEQEEDREGRRRELEALRVMELYQRAVACPSIEADEADEAMEGDQPKALLLELLLDRDGDTDRL